MNVQLNTREAHVLKSIMKPMASLCPEGSPIYYDMAIKMLQQQLFSPGALVTPNARQMLLSITEKIAYAQMSEDIDDILAEAQEIELEQETTKVQSMKKSKKNSSKGHLLIRSALQSTTEPLSRTELANLTNLRLSSVCARVRELIEEGEIQVAGTKWDKESERQVETLELV